MSGSSQEPLPIRLPASSVKPLTPLLDNVEPLMAGFEARSMLRAAPALFWKVLFVRVGLLVWMRTPFVLDLRTRLLVRLTLPPLMRIAAEEPAPPLRTSM